MGDGSVNATCDCVSRAKEWLSSIGCSDFQNHEAAQLYDADVVSGSDSFANGMDCMWICFFAFVFFINMIRSL